MFINKLFKFLLLVSFIIIVGLYFYSDLFINTLRNPVQYVVKHSLDLNEFIFSESEGNFFSGIKLYDVLVKSDNYEAFLGEVYIKPDILSVISLKRSIGIVKIKNADAYIYEIEKHGSSFLYHKIEILDSSIKYFGNSFFINDLVLESTSNNKRSVKGSLVFNYLGYKFKSEDLNIDFGNNFFNYSFKVSTVSPLNAFFSFKHASFIGRGENIFDFQGMFDASGITISGKSFKNFHGEIKRLNNEFIIDVPFKADKILKKDYLVAGNLKIKDSLLNIENFELYMNDFNPVVIKNQELFVNSDYWEGENFNLSYKKGKVFFNNFKIKDLSEYSADMIFDKLDINLFKGLKANGYLSGNLTIRSDSSNNSAVFSDAKIENFSYKKFSFDKVNIEGAIKDNELELSDLKISKQIGFLDVSGSFSSLDNFYNKIISNLNLKIKL
ncbi:MAG: hypothetical protein CMG00_02510 [Candidatus Marinimicrobia bacterium]|nr:hypothetical protein [Candidatus Neomarinimicrobiota bacterium]|tara:strand:+ start:752 stop:2071 length:1320 start_codon:yes stop_codon:yes gene_type:complete